jgi:hypothetical protein
MTNDVYLLILLLTFVVAYAIYWYTRPPNANDSSIESKSVEDPFLQQIASEKARIDKNVAAAQQQHERDLEERFAKDIQLKERLSQFAKDMELDMALIALWEEKELELSVSTQDLDFETWNRLQMSGITKGEGEKTKSVEFMQGTQHFKVTKRDEMGLGGEYWVEFSLWEADVEVFSISCSVNPDGYNKNYSCFGVSAFRRQGNWVKILLEYYEKIRIRQAKVGQVKYWGADEIKTRFKE